VYCLANVNEGSITFNKKNIAKTPTYKLLELGISYVPQGKINFTELTIKENLLLGSQSKDSLQKDMRYVFNKFPVLEKKQNQHAFSLSGGEQQMLAIGRALMQKPKIILMDEPSLGLSPKLQKELFAIIATLRKDGIGVLLVEQNAKKAIEIADRTYLLEQGAVVLTGGKSILKDKRIKEVYLGGA
jgi:branched-chain amino acid transport system ATP-binding protein